MHLHLLLMLGFFMAMTAAQPHCDPVTQYVKAGSCCSMCGPGTSMLSSSTCEEPQCKECYEDEYQDKYTTEPKCQRQKYCDPHKNFQVAVHESKKIRSACMCKLGFHCSSEACLTCVPHTNCAPGSGAQPIGNHTHDTVCKECPEGTFTDRNSWDSVCIEWITCKEGYKVQQSGTNVSDNKCEEESRAHIIAIAVAAAVLGILLAALAYWRWQRKQGYFKVQAKGCVESCLREEKDPQREAEEGELRTPEENEDDPSLQDTSANLRLTDNGNYVAQENGKVEVLSRQESQTETF